MYIREYKIRDANDLVYFLPICYCRAASYYVHKSLGVKMLWNFRSHVLLDMEPNQCHMIYLIFEAMLRHVPKLS